MRLWTITTPLALAALLPGGTARADFKVWLPDVNYGELALETVGEVGFDPKPNRSGEQSFTAEIEYGVTHWWQTELEFEFERDAGPGQSTYFNQVTSENLFQFTERGEYWLDAGFFAEYGLSTLKGNPNEITARSGAAQGFLGVEQHGQPLFREGCRSQRCDRGHNSSGPGRRG